MASLHSFHFESAKTWPFGCFDVLEIKSFELLEELSRRAELCTKLVPDQHERHPNDNVIKLRGFIRHILSLFRTPP